MSTLEEFRRSLTGAPESPTAVVERRYATTAHDLWEALTTPERLARWFGVFQGPSPTAVGESFVVDLGGDPEHHGGEADLGRGRILRCEEPNHLAYEWAWQNESPSEVAVDLREEDGPEGAGTRLRLRHARLDARHAAGYGGGWEQVLLALDDELTGTSRYAPRFAEHEAAAYEIWKRLLDGATPPESPT